MTTDQTPDPQTFEACKAVVAGLREKANIHNMLWNDNIEPKHNWDMRDYYNLLADRGQAILERSYPDKFPDGQRL